MIKIDLLINHPAAIFAITKIWQQKLDKNESIAEIESWYQDEFINNKMLPITFIALDNNIPTACALCEKMMILELI